MSSFFKQRFQSGVDAWKIVSRTVPGIHGEDVTYRKQLLAAAEKLFIKQGAGQVTIIKGIQEQKIIAIVCR